MRRIIRRALPATAIASLLVLSSVLALTFANRAAAQPVVVEATAPIEDPSEDGINAALDAALESAVRGALALGLEWIQVHGAYLGDGYVGVQVLAAARAPSGGATERAPEGDVPGGRATRILYDL